MKCQFCDNPASVFYTQIIEGKEKKVNLCEDCAEERGIMDLEQFGLEGELIGDIPNVPPLPAEPDATIHLGECSHCGFSLEDFRKIGRLGCTECYSMFASEIKGMLEKMHKGASHIGKAPTGMMAVLARETKLKDLETSLKKAIKSEEFEEAARLRDEIKAFKEEELEVK